MTNDQTLNPQLQSWIPSAQGSEFPIQNLPLGIYKPPHVGEHSGRICVAIGNSGLDLFGLEQAGVLNVPGVNLEVLQSSSCNDLISLGRKKLREVRERLSTLLSAQCQELQANQAVCERVFFDLRQAELLLPVQVGDFVDFYSSLEHASNVGTMFRDPSNPLLPNWKHIPIGYHGRSSSLMVSGQNFYRPCGQIKPEENAPPLYKPSRQLDFELEMGFVIGRKTFPGDVVEATRAADYMCGMVIVNDWSARDIQKWEYVPLGPFLGKSFATTVSPWLVSMDVIEALRVAEPVRDVAILPYLEDGGDKALDIELCVEIQTQKMAEPKVICRTNFKGMYWTIHQQLAHMTSNGTPIRIGDLYASGTVSGKTPDSFGSMLELCWKGTKPLELPSGEQRSFIEDYDRVIMSAAGTLPGGIRVGFGKCEAQVLPARQQHELL